MDAKARDKALERARSLEKGGQGDAAAKLFREAGALEDAARIASMKPGEFDTGAMLAPAKAPAVGGQAVSILSAQKLEEQGKLEAALETYVQLKRFADAGRLAKALGRTANAAEFYADAGVP